MSVGPVNFAAAGGLTAPGKTSGGTGFGQELNNALQSLSDSQKKADNAVENFLTGGNEDPSQVTVAMDEAKIRIELAVQVRNKIVNAYKDIWDMPI